mmetsp:Transcript_66038/g.110817  ORF Transcript_66038/g.110817 Transcript_66038/m.110817 type:complete len:88 (+) Transcript_66038:819-1082(+)
MASAYTLEVSENQQQRNSNKTCFRCRSPKNDGNNAQCCLDKGVFCALQCTWSINMAWRTILKAMEQNMLHMPSCPDHFAPHFKGGQL